MFTSKNDFKSRTFHEKCDGAKNTVTLVERKDNRIVLSKYGEDSRINSNMISPFSAIKRAGCFST